MIVAQLHRHHQDANASLHVRFQALKKKTKKETKKEGEREILREVFEKEDENEQKNWKKKYFIFKKIKI